MIFDLCAIFDGVNQSQVVAMSDYSAQEFNDFLDYLADKGLVKVNTVRGWKSATSKIFSILGEEELEDLREVNVEDVCLRFANKNGKDIAPASLKTYKSRLKTSLDEFFSWKENPVGYKPVSSQYVKKDRKPDQSKDTSKSHETNFSGNSEETATLTFPVPIRPDVIVKITDLPVDLTEIEAEKISMVIKALSVSKVQPERDH